jgi:glycosyltransferase involved in cell wall biosynthesis
MRSTEPLVSVVTPSFNYARYIRRCLESVRDQTYPHIEHIVLDNCSTDGTGEILRTFEGRPGFQAIIEKDRGQSHALNRGFARAQGDIFCWLNADDFYLDSRVIAAAVARLQSSGADLVAGGGHIVDANDRVGDRIHVDPERAASGLRYWDTFLQPATFWRRSVHRPLREDLHYAFDWLLFAGMVRGGGRLVVADEPWAAYRLHGSGKTQADPARRRAEIAEVLSAHFGSLSPQHLWARLVWAGYRVSELTGLRVVKSTAARADDLIRRLTHRRVGSS